MIEELTDVTRGRVAVRPKQMRFGRGCFACPDSSAAPVRLRFTRTLLLGVVGGIESDRDRGAAV